MSEANPIRGEVTVELGELGEIVCRPGFRALSKIDASPCGPLSMILFRLQGAQSLNDVVTTLYETHLDSDQKPKRKREQIGEAVMAQGMDCFYQACADLIGTAWSKRAKDEDADKDAEGDSGN